MQIRRINNEDKETLLICEKKVSDNYLDNLVLIGDLHKPCIDKTRIFGLFDDSILETFFVIFDGFMIPSVVLPTNLSGNHFVLIKNYLNKILPNEFLFLTLEYNERDLADTFEINFTSVDLCMYLDSGNKLPEEEEIIVKKANELDFTKIDSFYKNLNVSPWAPIQFQSNFYHYIEIDGRIIACGGTHFETPRLAQLGNIFVTKSNRRRGFGKALTTAITKDVLSRKEFATLFVRFDNFPAQQLYKKLGYKIHKEARLIFCLNNLK